MVAEALEHSAAGSFLLAVSGGQDSMCLLDAVLSAAGKGSIHVCHVDHGLRSGSSRDADFVSTFCRSAGVPCTVGRVDTPGLMRSERLSAEVAARRLRREAMENVRCERGLDLIVIGHTADDQAETVLMHVLRGAGLHGLGGMARFQPPLLRPLLGVWRRDTEAYCRAVDIPFVTDRTNEDRSNPRNRIRLELLPEAERVFPGARRSLTRLARVARRDEALLDELADEAMREVVANREIIGPLWRALVPALRYHVLLKLAEANGTPASESTLETESARLATEASRRLDSAIPTVLLKAAPLAAEKLTIPGRTHVCGITIDATHLPCSDAVRRQMVVAAPWEAYLDAEAIGDGLVVRGWQPGDRIHLLGSAGTRKLQDIFVDAKVPAHLRSQVPLIGTERNVVWVPGLTTSELGRLGDGTKVVLHISVALDAMVKSAPHRQAGSRHQTAKGEERTAKR